MVEVSLFIVVVVLNRISRRLVGSNFIGTSRCFRANGVWCGFLPGLFVLGNAGICDDVSVDAVVVLSSNDDDDSSLFSLLDFALSSVDTEVKLSLALDESSVDLIVVEELLLLVLSNREIQFSAIHTIRYSVL